MVLGNKDYVFGYYSETVFGDVTTLTLWPVTHLFMNVADYYAVYVFVEVYTFAVSLWSVMFTVLCLDAHSELFIASSFRSAFLRSCFCHLAAYKWYNDTLNIQL